MVTKTKTRLGNQRPTQSVTLHYAESLAHEAIELYQKTGRSCYPWQVNLLEHIMGIDTEGLWVHQKYGYAIPRRNGKTEDVYMLELWALHHGLKILHTAHRISTSHSSFEA
ncbi:TPA: terminase, partial [Streptococcus suis]|nr:terminase [Streptococcus suis]HEM4497531.1 terminase [Streptococcus suis]HEM4566747.1 terminase [Streptococcus suis]